MTDRGHAYALGSAMMKPPRNPPSSTGAPRSPAGAPRPEKGGQPTGEVDSSNPFASLAALDEPGGETKAYEVPRELIELARARAAEPKTSKGTLTPIAPRPNAELEATLAAYTAGLAATSSARTPSSRPSATAPALRSEVHGARNTPAGPYEESGTVLRNSAARPAGPPPLPVQPPAEPPSEPLQRSEALQRIEAVRQGGSARVPAAQRTALLRSPVSPNSKPVARPRSAPVTAATAQKRPWALYLGLCLVVGYCAHLLLSS